MIRLLRMPRGYIDANRYRKNGRLIQMIEFPSMDEVNAILSDLADEIPSDFFIELHGGILLIEPPKMHPDSQTGRPLYIMGEYVRNNLGCQIKIYYGSFKKIYPTASINHLRDALKETLIHEFTHHLEHRAGLRGLEIKDAKMLSDYKKK